jgi:hypothetical protein
MQMALAIATPTIAHLAASCQAAQRSRRSRSDQPTLSKSRKGAPDHVLQQRVMPGLVKQRRGDLTLVSLADASRSLTMLSMAASATSSSSSAVHLLPRQKRLSAPPLR